MGRRDPDLWIEIWTGPAKEGLTRDPQGPQDLEIKRHIRFPCRISDAGNIISCDERVKSHRGNIVWRWRGYKSPWKRCLDRSHYNPYWAPSELYFDVDTGRMFPEQLRTMVWQGFESASPCFTFLSYGPGIFAFLEPLALEGKKKAYRIEETHRRWLLRAEFKGNLSKVVRENHDLLLAADSEAEASYRAVRWWRSKQKLSLAREEAARRWPTDLDLDCPGDSPLGLLGAVLNNENREET